MEPLTITMILSVMSTQYCKARENHLDHVKATLSAFSYVTDKYDSSEVRDVIINTPGLTPLALASVTIKCPQHLN